MFDRTLYRNRFWTGLAITGPFAVIHAVASSSSSDPLLVTLTFPLIAAILTVPLVALVLWPLVWWESTFPYKPQPTRWLKAAVFGLVLCGLVFGAGILLNPWL